MMFLSKGHYIGSIEILPQYNVLHGRVISYKGKCVDDVITYNGKTPKELYENFEKTINDYIKYKEYNKKQKTDEENFEIIKIATKELVEPIENFLYKIITIVDKTIKKGLHK